MDQEAQNLAKDKACEQQLWDAVDLLQKALENARYEPAQRVILRAYKDLHEVANTISLRVQRREERLKVGSP